RAANRCSICRRELSADKKHGDSSYPIGEQAHIVAENDEGPRGKSILSAKERESYRNLILLCPTHHSEIDKAPEDYPVERLHMMKQEHEDWVRESLHGFPGWDVPIQEEKYLRDDKEVRIVNFVKEWLDFLAFFDLFYIKIESYLLNSKNSLVDLPRTDILEWHKRRGILRELLFITGETNLIVQKFISWDQLKTEDSYLSEWNYETPFSFILNFINPIAMVNLHGSAVWQASGISKDYIERLSWKYSGVKVLYLKT
ncbi:hypothetical protein LCGC14_1492280, partial [marine sediment metagenome]